MGETTAISWCDHTFNPVWGCAKVSPGCDHCYAEAWDKRTGGAHWGAGAPRRTFGDKHWNEPRRWNAAAEKAGVRRRVFCASMADVFDNEWPEGEREKLWPLIRETPHLVWLLLTKRIGNTAKMLPADWGDGYANVWLLATIVNQEEAERDGPKLARTPALVRGWSVEPMLGPIDIDAALSGLRNPDWIICGGESGGKARPMHPRWASGLRDQCTDAGIAFHFKQWGEWAPVYDPATAELRTEGSGREGARWTDGICERFPTGDGHGDVFKLGKHRTGRLLDGRTWDEFPTPSGGSGG